MITAEVLRSVERQRSGVAAGTLNTMRQGGSAIGVAVFGSQIAAGFASGFRIVLVISIGLAVAIGGFTILLSPRAPSHFLRKTGGVDGASGQRYRGVLAAIPVLHRRAIGCRLPGVPAIRARTNFLLREPLQAGPLGRLWALAGWGVSVRCDDQNALQVSVFLGF